MSRASRCASLSLFLVLSIMAAWAAAQAPRAMTIVDLLNLPSLSDPQLSPDGQQILYVKSEPDWKDNRRVTHIWRVNRDGAGTVQLTRGERGESSPRWSPDGRTIALVTRRDADEANQIYLLSNAGGEAQRLTKHETGVRSLTWSRDGALIYFLAAEPKPADLKDREKVKDDVYAFDENVQQDHLWKVTVATGAEERITSGDFSIASYNLSRDGRRIAHQRTPNPLFGYADRGEVWVMNADGTQPTQLTKNSITEGGAKL